MDIMWVLDESGSVKKRNYLPLLEFVALFAGMFEDSYGPNGTRFGYVEFASFVNSSENNVLLFEEAPTLDDFQNSVRALNYSKGYTATTRALEFVDSYFRVMPPRPDAQRIVIFSTDGNPKNDPDDPDADPDNTPERARLLALNIKQNYDAGFIYMPVGIEPDRLNVPGKDPRDPVDPNMFGTVPDHILPSYFEDLDEDMLRALFVATVCMEDYTDAPTMPPIEV